MSLDDAFRAAIAAAIWPLAEEVRAARAELASLRESTAPRMGSVADAARIAGVCELTIRRKFAAGEIAGKRIGRRVVLDLSSLRPADRAKVVELARVARTR
jgi:hypothetical protein